MLRLENLTVVRDFLGTLTFFIAGTSTFRIIYGRWPPTGGNFGLWLLSDGKAIWAIAAGLLVGMVATSIWRGLIGTLHPSDPRLEDPSRCLQLGMTYHQERRIEEATQMFKRAITLYADCGGAEAATAYASLGKLYFDTGALDLAEQQLMEARARFAQQIGTRGAAATTDALLQLIAERRRASDRDTRYSDALFHFAFTIPPGWVEQSIVGQSVQTPRGTPENRPYGDTAKPANGIKARTKLL